MEISKMTRAELEMFDFLNTKLEVQTISTEDLRKVIQNTRKALDDQEKAIKEDIENKKKYLNELEKIVGQLEKGTFKK